MDYIPRKLLCNKGLQHMSYVLFLNAPTSNKFGKTFYYTALTRILQIPT